MRLRTPIASMALAAWLLPGPAAHAWLLDEKDPVLKEIIPDVTFFAGFDDGTGDADLSVGDNKAAASGKPVFEAGISGKAFRGGEFRYPVEKNLQVDRPGSLSFWLCPHQWVRGSDEPLLSFFMTDYKSDGFLGVERQGQIIKDGRLVRGGGLLFWAHYFKGIPNQSPMCACDRKDGEWHLLVLTWRGRRWELSVDGVAQLAVELPRAIKQEELSKQLVVCGNALIDEFTIYRRPLAQEEVQRLHAAGKARHAGKG